MAQKLFDKASLVMIPSQYKEGKIYNIKPEDQSSSFEFERGSAATRVNEDGLIEYVGIGTENVANSNFDTVDNWSTGSTTSSFTVTDGVAIVQGDANSFNTRISQNLTLEASTTYLINVRIKSNDGNYWRVRGYDNVRGYFDIEFNNSSEFSEINYVYTTASTFNGVFILYISSHFQNGSEDFSIDFASIKDISNDTPRIDYTNGKTLLLEPQRINLLSYSEDFSTSGGWGLNGTTISPNNTISPDGNLNASLFKGDTDTSRHNVTKAGLTGSVSAACSIFVKAKELRYIQIASANTGAQYANFDVKDGVVGTVGSDFSNAKIEDYGNGWYRCSAVSTNRYNGFWISLVSGLNAGWLENWSMPNNTDGLYIWGAQLEDGSYATSHIPTNGQAETRLADTILTKDITSIITSDSFTWFLDLDDWQGSDSNSGELQISEPNGIRIQFRIRSDGYRFYYHNIQGGAQYPVGGSTTANKFCVSYDGQNYRLYIDGVKVSTISSVGDTGWNEFSNRAGLGATVTTPLKQMLIFPEALTDTELQELTTI